MNLNDYKGILVFAEQRDGVVQNVGLELIGKAKELAAKLDVPVTAALIGYNVEGLDMDGYTRYNRPPETVETVEVESLTTDGAEEIKIYWVDEDGFNQDGIYVGGND